MMFGDIATGYCEPESEVVLQWASRSKAPSYGQAAKPQEGDSYLKIN